MDWADILSCVNLEEDAFQNIRECSISVSMINTFLKPNGFSSLEKDILAPNIEVKQNNNHHS